MTLVGFLPPKVLLERWSFSVAFFDDPREHTPSLLLYPAKAHSSFNPPPLITLFSWIIGYNDIESSFLVLPDFPGIFDFLLQVFTFSILFP